MYLKGKYISYDNTSFFQFLFQGSKFGAMFKTKQFEPTSSACQYLFGKTKNRF